MLRTLLANGYEVHKVDRNATHVLIDTSKRDVLSGVAKVSILLTLEPNDYLLQLLKKASDWHKGTGLVIFAEDSRQSTGFPSMQLKDFYAVLGGEVDWSKVLVSNLSQIMSELGRNLLPSGFDGEPDTLLEEYTKDCLCYLLGGQGHRYGQERRFESVPDGKILANDGINVLFDAKAYSEGFHPSADDIKRFADYVNEFNSKYGRHVGSVYSFVVVSGIFPKSSEAIIEKSAELRARCNANLCCLTSGDLGAMVTLARNHSRELRAIPWKRLLAMPHVTLHRFENALETVKSDRVF